MNDLRIGMDAFFPEFLDFARAVEKKVVSVYIKAFHDFVSAKADETYVHVGKVLLRLYGETGAGKREENISNNLICREFVV